MTFWKTPQGEELTFGQFMNRWKEGIQNVSPLFQVKSQIKSTYIMILGIVLGIGVSIYNYETLWWLTIILLGALGNTSVQLIALIQKKKMLKGFDNMIDLMGERK